MASLPWSEEPRVAPSAISDISIVQIALPRIRAQFGISLMLAARMRVDLLPMGQEDVKMSL
jgi:hypothetical protein